MRHSKYMTRALASKDGRFAVVLGKLGHVAPIASPPPNAAPSIIPGLSSDDGQAVSELTVLRLEYQAVVGTKPYHGWDAETLRVKIAAAKESD